MRALLDVNVLVALFAQNHTLTGAAETWLAGKYPARLGALLADAERRRVHSRATTYPNALSATAAVMWLRKVVLTR